MGFRGSDAAVEVAAVLTPEIADGGDGSYELRRSRSASTLEISGILCPGVCRELAAQFLDFFVGLSSS
jgi:hypothetical protein